MATSTMEKSTSREWREKGNNFYQRVTDGLAPTLQVQRLLEASNCYGRALSTAADDNERSSAYKNMAVASWKMATVQSVINDNNFSNSVIFHFKQALRHFQDARDRGSGQPEAWHGSLMDTAVRCWFDVSAMMDSWETEERVAMMHQLVGYILDDCVKAREYLEITNHYFHWSVVALSNRDYRQCLTLLKDCHYPLREAERLGHRDPVLVRECLVLDEDIYVQSCVAESIQERMKGEELLSHVLRDEEVLNIDMIWEVVDSFRMAAHMTRDRDLEMEAMALSDLGRVYDKILKMKDRAKACLMKVLELANTMVPRNFTGEDWFEFARSTVERYQQEQLKKMEEQYQKEREEVLKEIKEEMDALKKNHIDLSMQGFLKFVYKTHPPKNPEHKPPEESDFEESGLKKLYQKAVIHYHPDKVRVEEHGKTWKVLSEEITKLLTNTYESLK